jgi:multiple antibiotic resistance protein
MDVISTVISLSFTLFLLMDSIGNVPLFISILKDFPPQEQKTIIRRELIIALIVIATFYFLGDFLMDLMDIKQETISISGGIILFMISIKMVFSSTPSLKENKASSYAEAPFIVPLAIPLIAGPAVLATVIVYAQQEQPLVALSSIAIAWAASAGVLSCASKFKKLLGNRGLLACEKLMGLLLTLMAVQMCLKGLTIYLCDLKNVLP